MPEKTEKQETTRVAMMFPVGLKAELQELAGPRGLTNWVIDACQERLAGASNGERIIGPKSEIHEARKIAQKLADTLANFDDDPNPQRILQEMELPKWLAQGEWPEWLRTEPAESVEPASDQVKETSDWIEDAPEAEVKDKFEALGPEPTVGPPSGDLLAKVMAKADELGISKADFKIASDLPVPPKPSLEPPESEVSLKCAKCGSEMVGDECWSCAPPSF